MLFRIKFKQLFRDSTWLQNKITFVFDERDNPESESQSVEARRIHESVRLAARLHFFKAECLAKSIVLADMLGSRGMSAQLVIGVSKKGGVFSSHAWVEVDGFMIGEPESIKQDFIVLKR